LIRTARWLTLLLGMILVSSGRGEAADADKPHPHQGVLEGYEELPELELTQDQLEDLAKGKVVMMSFPTSDEGGRGVAVLDISAPPDTVWSRITNYGRHPKWVGPVKVCEIYAQRGDTTYTHVIIKGFLYRYEYYLENRFEPGEGILIWSLDYSRESDFDDNVGCWFVEPHPEKAGWSRAWFSCDIALRQKIPGFLMKYVKKKALQDATSWVKRESERSASD